MLIKIPIISDIYSAKELAKLFELNSSLIEFELHESDEVLRSPLSDPTVLVALIQAGTTTLAALIAFFGVVWSTKRKKEKKKVDIIEIKVKPGCLNQLTKRQIKKLKLLLDDEESIDSDILRLPNPGKPVKGNDYNDILADILLDDVEHISIIGDE